MTFMEEFKDRATDVASVTGKKVTEVYNITKLSLAIAEKKGVLRGLYRELGEMMYKAAKREDSGIEDREAMEDVISEIDIVIEDIKELKEAQTELRSQRICPNCGEGIADDANYCSNCGVQI